MAAIAAVALLAGCAGDDDDDDAGGVAPTATMAVPTATMPPATATVTAPPAPTATQAPATPTATATEAPTATATPETGPAFAGAGPYPVGVTTLELSDRPLEVWYPVDPGAVEGLETTSYRAFDVLPPSIVAILPPELNLEIAMDAYRDVPASGDGPFPVLTFSHGAGGFRMAYSGLLAGIASHGFVVASLEHLEWGLLAQVGLLPAGVDRSAEDVVLETLAALSAASEDGGSPLAGGVDGTRVATAGHSAGRRAAFAVNDRPQVRAMFGFATGSGSTGIVTGKPALLLVGTLDAGAPGLETAYEALAPIKRFVSVDEAGHNSFTDQCAVIHGGNNFLEDLVEAGFPIPQNLLDLAIDGCRPENLAPAQFWRVVQHFTVAQLRAAFGIDDPPVGLDDDVATAFAGVTMRYRHDEGDGTPVPDPMGFVVGGFAQVAAQHEVEVCPAGFNPDPTQFDPPLPDDCEDPLATVDDRYQTIAAPGVVDGVDLDGVDSQNAGAPDDPCGHDDFRGPSGETGIDLNGWRAVGCIRGFQPGELADTVVDQAVRNGGMTILLEAFGVDDIVDDDFVQVRVYGSTDSPELGGDGSVLPFSTLNAHEDLAFHSTIADGRIVDGVLTAGPIDLRLRLNIQIVSSDFTLHDGVVRMRLESDGSASGQLFGFHPIEEFYDRLARQTGQAGTQALGFTCTGMWAALVEHADGGFDPDAQQCTSISAGYDFSAVPAFVAK